MLIRFFSTKKGKHTSSSDNEDIIPSDSNISSEINDRALVQSTKKKFIKLSNLAVDETRNSCKLFKVQTNNENPKISNTSKVSISISNEYCNNMESAGKEYHTQKTIFFAIQSKPLCSKRQDIVNSVIREN